MDAEDGRVVVVITNQTPSNVNNFRERGERETQGRAAFALLG